MLKFTCTTFNKTFYTDMAITALLAANTMLAICGIASPHTSVARCLCFIAVAYVCTAFLVIDTEKIIKTIRLTRALNKAAAPLFNDLQYHIDQCLTKRISSKSHEQATDGFTIDKL